MEKEQFKELIFEISRFSVLFLIFINLSVTWYIITFSVVKAVISHNIVDNLSLDYYRFFILIVLTFNIIALLKYSMIHGKRIIALLKNDK